MKYLLPLLSLAPLAAIANQFGPHVPKGSPWFEGWYTRITSLDTKSSIGFIFGQFPDQHLESPSTYGALLFQESPKTPLYVVDVYPPQASLTVNHGQRVTENPDDTSPAVFKYAADGFGEYVCNGDVQSFNFTFPGGIELSGHLSNPEPWGPNGEGPEGWASKLHATGFDWFAYTLRSKVQYQLSIPSKNINLSGQGYAHQEKNWGDSFPDSWIWAQGISNDRSNSHFALAGGPTKVGPLTVTAYLVGYRSFSLNWSFHPQDPSLFTPTIRSCDGYFNLVAKDVTGKMLNITIQAEPKSFTKVGCPTRTGFRRFSDESFVSHVIVEAYQFGQLVETTSFDGAGLEFGGDYMCSPNADRESILVSE